MKKKTVFRIVLIVLCVLCALSVLQVRNVLANHRQNERDDSTDDSFGEDYHDLVLPETPGLAYDDSTDDSFDEDSPHDLVLPHLPKFEPMDIKPRIPEFPSDAYQPSNYLLYEYDGYWSMRFGEYFRLDDGNKNVDDNIPIPQGPPAFKDMSELYGRMMETDDDRNKDVMENKLNTAGHAEVTGTKNL